MCEVFRIAGWSLKSIRKNPRVLLCILLGFLICFFLTQRTITLSEKFSSSLQILEPFVWCFSDSDSVLFSSLAIFLVLSDIPRMDSPSMQVLFRTGRLKWVLGQIVTAAAVSVMYAALLMGFSMLLCAPRAFWADTWSETAILLSFSPSTFEVALPVVRKMIKLTTPVTGAFYIFSLLAQYMLFLSLLKLAFTLLGTKRAGITAVMVASLCGYVLSPSRFIGWFSLNEPMYYYANLWAAWLSPLQHATYVMHNFGYDRLPTIMQSHGIFTGLSVGLAGLSCWGVRRVSGAQEEE